MITLLALFGISASAAVIAPRQAAPSVSVPASVPSGASAAVDPKFPSYAFEIASFVEYATDADGNPNTFSQNLIAAITARTGSDPIIRVGGTSADFALLIADQTEAALPVAAQNNYQNIGNTTIGPSFWSLFANFPNASFVFQVPLGINDPIEAAEFATSGINTIGLDRIQAIEIGNEPDAYPDTNWEGVLLEPPVYQGAVTNDSYVSLFGTFASAVSSALDLPANEAIFQAFDTSHHFGDGEGYILDVPTVFEAGINDNDTIIAVSHHYYQTEATSGSLQEGLLNHAAIVYELDYLQPFIEYCHSTTTSTHSSAIPFILGEVGNSLNAGNNYTYQNVLGSALWQVDFQLYALAIGVDRIYWQQIMHAGYDLWLPIESAGFPAQVFANYYAQPFIADFVSSSNNTQIAQLNLTSAPDYILAYAAYVGGVLERVAVVNLNLWDAAIGSTRPTTQLTLNLPTDVVSATVKTLNSPDGAYADASSITYGGSQWTAASLGVEVPGVDASGLYTSTVTGGVLTLSVDDSAAYLITLST